MNVSPGTMVLAAAEPGLVAAMKAVMAFNTNIGTDPAKWAFTVPGALTILVGTLQLQVPVLVGSEIGALQTALNSKLASAIASLEAKVAPAGGLPPA